MNIRFAVACFVVVSLALFGSELRAGVAGPDLSPELGEVSPTTVPLGFFIDIPVTVRNIGSQSSTETTLRYFVSNDSVITPTDTELGTSAIGSLSADGSTSRSYSGPLDEPPGTYWVGACVDTVAGDTDTTNDCSASVQVVVPDIDLAALSVTPSAFEFPTGSNITLSTAVDNRGADTTGTSTLRYKLSGNATISEGDADLTTTPVPSLDGGERFTDQVQAVIDPGGGTFWLGACVDELNGETDSDNNCSVGTQIEVLSDSLPDLIVSEVIANPPTWTLGAFTDLFAEITNQGTAESGATEVRFYLSTDSTVTNADMLLGTDNVNALAAGASMETGIFVDPQPAPGDYWYGACVIDDGIEFLTDNNCSAGEPVSVFENDNACVNLPLSCGDNVSGSLSASDCDNSPRGTGHYAKRHDFEGSTGQEVTIDASWTSDGYLYLVNPSGGVAAENDDRAGDPGQSRIEFTLNSTGTWTVWTTTVQTDIELDFDLSLSCGEVPTPDLVIDSPSADPQSTGPGGTVTVAGTVSNQGTGDSEETTVNFLISMDDVIEPGDVVGASVLQGPLGAGGGLSNVQANITAPLEAGNYWVGLCADAVTGEEDTANNCSAAVALTVNENTNACEDIAAQCGEMSAHQLAAQDCDNSPRGAGFLAKSHTFSASNGELVTIQAEFDGDGFLYLTDAMGAVLAENDNAGDMLTSRIEFGINADGQYTAWVTTAEPAAMLAYDFSLTCESSAETDLTVDAPALEPLTVEFGDPLSLSTTVRNAGPDASAPTELRYLISTDATISLDDSNIRTSQVPSIAGGGTDGDSVVVTALIEPGFYWAGVCVDAVVGESDSTNNCSAGVEFEVTDGSGIAFNQGLNDAWFNPATGGQGFFINVFKDIGKVFLAWFTYELERPDPSVLANLGGPGHRWLTAFGDFQDGVASLDIEKTSGGVFNSEEPAPAQILDGTINLRFANCGEGSVAFVIPSLGMSGVVPIQRLGDDNVDWCNELVDAAPAAEPAPAPQAGAVSRPEGVGDFQINEGLNDAWFNPDTGGQGFFINVFPDIGKMFLSWFTYETARPDESVTAQLGEPGHRWLTAFGDYADNEAVLEIEKTTGGVFNQAEPDPVQEADGTIIVEFTDCETGTVTFDIESIEQQGIVPIQRLALDSVAACEELDGAAAEAHDNAD